MIFNKDDPKEVKESLLPWQERGLMETASGYGRKLTTSYKVFYSGKWYRVYCCCFSNSGTLYIKSKGKEINIDIQ